jgi:hypothetical protein
LPVNKRQHWVKDCGNKSSKEYGENDLAEMVLLKIDATMAEIHIER